MNKQNIVLGGDWNCTWDCRGVESNLDCLNMAAIPSKRRSEKLKNISDTFMIQDPFRCLYPNKREFSYVPAALDYTNRSRLDFFLISISLLEILFDCWVSPALLSSRFDHKMAFLSFEKGNRFPKNKQIQARHIENKILGAAVKISAWECYTQHAAINQLFTIEQKNDLLNKIGLLYQGIENINFVEKSFVGREVGEQEENEQAAGIALLFGNLNELPDPAFFENLELTADPEFFFESLCCATRTAGLKQQSHLYKIGESREESIKKDS